ncbi:CRISPR-associated endoribonuclease Cas2, partial [termite gut metagenome]
REAKKFMKEEGDSIIIFKGRQKIWIDKEIIGKERGNIDIFL